MRPDARDSRAVLAKAGLAAEYETLALGEVARVLPADVIAALSALKDAGYESLIDFDGIDTGEDIVLTWRLRSYSADCETYVRANVPYGARIASVWNVFPSALMPERETAELFGLTLAGHPNPKRLLTTDGVPPLLLKEVPIRSEEEVKAR